MCSQTAQLAFVPAQEQAGGNGVENPFREGGRTGNIASHSIASYSAQGGHACRAVKVNDRFPLPDHYFCAMIRTCRRKRCSPAKPDAPQRRQCVPDDVRRCGKDVARRPPFAQSRRTISGGSFFDQGQSSPRRSSGLAMMPAIRPQSVGQGPFCAYALPGRPVMLEAVAASYP